MCIFVHRGGIALQGAGYNKDVLYHEQILHKRISEQEEIVRLMRPQSGLLVLLLY
jgi:hypothetical protein